MSKKKRDKPEGEHSSPQDASRASGSGEAPPFGPRSMEKMMRDLTKLLEEQEFESIEEANAFLEQFRGRPIPEMPAYQGFGDESEAIDYASTGIALW